MNNVDTSYPHWVWVVASILVLATITLVIRDRFFKRKGKAPPPMIIAPLETNTTRKSEPHYCLDMVGEETKPCPERLTSRSGWCINCKVKYPRHDRIA